jgi:hypothetical protein
VVVVEEGIVCDVLVIVDSAEQIGRFYFLCFHDETVEEELEIDVEVDGDVNVF